MSFSISPENQQFLDRAVASGLFPDHSKAVDEAIRLLRERGRLRLAIQQGIKQLECGEFVAYEDTDEERFVADIEALAVCKSR